ncbi:MAG: OmpA family protein, partial [Alphaproteobacteria bacterium]|nr:OmpA family protein [Alphaproteobacteria bacterium]
HGGAWKVAYADFVTAMMAFFLLLWLLNVTTEEQLNAISNYFDPSHPQISQSNSGAGGVLGGLTMAEEGAQAEKAQPLTARQESGSPDAGKKITKRQASREMLEEALRKKEDAAFKQAKADIEKALQNNPALAELAKSLMIDITPEGLRIQIVDQDGKPMFPAGSAAMFEWTQTLLTMVASAIQDMPNDISVRGHTDAAPYGPGATYTNWELSADRANASRRVLMARDIPEARMANIMGKADREPLIVDDPFDPQNRRITILLLRESLDDALARGAFAPEEVTQEPPEADATDTPEPGALYDPYADTDDTTPLDPGYLSEEERARLYQKTPGSVYFP